MFTAATGMCLWKGVGGRSRLKPLRGIGKDPSWRAFLLSFKAPFNLANVCRMRKPYGSVSSASYGCAQ
jgi:hypothetical protein